MFCAVFDDGADIADGMSESCSVCFREVVSARGDLDDSLFEERHERKGLRENFLKDLGGRREM